MVRSELIRKIAEDNPHIGLDGAERVVEVFFEEITATLARGGRVELRGFGAFSVKHRQARIGHNPRTGEEVHVPATSVPFFKYGKGIFGRLNGTYRNE